MKDDLEGKILEELTERERLIREIDLVDHMRVHQIDIAVLAAGDAAKELASEGRITIHANINSRFLPFLDDRHIQLGVCQKRIDRLTQNQNRT